MQVIIFDTIQYQCVWFLSTKQYHFATNLLMMITADDGGESPHAFGTAAGISCARGISSPLTWVKGSGVLGRLVGFGMLRRPEMTRDSEPSLRTQAVSEKNHGPTLYRFRWFSHSNQLWWAIYIYLPIKNGVSIAMCQNHPKWVMLVRLSFENWGLFSDKAKWIQAKKLFHGYFMRSCLSLRFIKENI